MKNILLVGGGKIGVVVADLLAHAATDGEPDYHVTVVDRDKGPLAGLPRHPQVQPLVMDVSDDAALKQVLQGKFAVLSALPYHLTLKVAQAARVANNGRGVHYLDLTEDVASTRSIRELAADAECAFIPQCGLAPGFIGIVAHDLAQRFTSLD